MTDTINYEMCDNILVNLRKIVQAMSKHSRQLQRNFAITAPQLIVLREINRVDTITIGALAQQVSLSNATVTGIIDRLEQVGYVTRSRNGKDRRQVFLSCTEKGKEIAAEAPPLFQEHFITTLAKLSEAEQNRMVSLLSDLAGMMGNMNPVEEEAALNGTASEPNGFIDACRMLLDTTEDAPSVESPKTDSGVVIVHTDHDFPAGVDREVLTQFLHEHLKPYEDAPEDILSGIAYALDTTTSPGGFIVLKLLEQRVVGALVMLNTGMTGYVPEHMLLFVAVHKDMRGKGLGAEVIKQAQQECTGNIKLHVEYDNPAKRLYERLGFSSKYAEMRWNRELPDHKS